MLAFNPRPFHHPRLDKEYRKKTLSVHGYCREQSTSDVPQDVKAMIKSFVDGATKHRLYPKEWESVPTIQCYEWHILCAAVRCGISDNSTFECKLTQLAPMVLSGSDSDDGSNDPLKALFAAKSKSMELSIRAHCNPMAVYDMGFRYRVAIDGILPQQSGSSTINGPLPITILSETLLSQSEVTILLDIELDWVRYNQYISERLLVRSMPAFPLQKETRLFPQPVDASSVNFNQGDVLHVDVDSSDWELSVHPTTDSKRYCLMVKLLRQPVFVKQLEYLIELETSTSTGFESNEGILRTQPNVQSAVVSFGWAGHGRLEFKLSVHLEKIFVPRVTGGTIGEFPVLHSLDDSAEAIERLREEIDQIRISI